MNPLYEALSLDPSKDNYIAIVGGGGKTSVMYRLAEEFYSSGKYVIATTSTHIFIPNHVTVVLSNDKEEILAALRKERLIAVASEYKDDKLKTPDSGLFEYFGQIADNVITEADGARRHPLKAPAENEPVIPEYANTVIAVTGLDALGGKIIDVCHRPKMVAKLLGINESAIASHIITHDDIAKIITSSNGYKKAVTLKHKFIAVLNKADTIEAEHDAEIIAELIKDKGVQNITISAIRLNKWRKYPC